MKGDNYNVCEVELSFKKFDNNKKFYIISGFQFILLLYIQ